MCWGVKKRRLLIQEKRPIAEQKAVITIKKDKRYLVIYRIQIQD